MSSQPSSPDDKASCARHVGPAVKQPLSQFSAQRTTQHTRKIKRAARVVGIVVILIIAVVSTTAACLVNAGKSSLLQGVANVKTSERTVSQNSGKTVTHNGQTYQLNENVTSICIIGNDQESTTPAEGYNGQADVIMVIALDTETGKATGISIPRDSMVEVNRNYSDTKEFHDTSRMQICLAYAYGATDEESSELVCTAVSRVLYNIPLTYYYTMSMSGIASLADAVGGVTVEALQTIPDTSIHEGETVTLRGSEALDYVWWRDESRYGTALDRQARQQQFVTALASQALTTAKSDPAALVNLFNAMSEYSTTNLGTAEFSYLASIVAGSGIESLSLTDLKGEPVHNEESFWEQFILDKDAVYQTVLDVYYTPVGEPHESEKL
ncbi:MULTISPECIES: LCP family protein [unclassified Adlercreutzia]|uniref:LCP family protein n=1 Tax=unclassified Adlercreutzia TaxID=2636013 RepID=UPI0013ECBE71|nr:MULTISPECIES: LCP family protein [unclassified Adlercreutzia]